jgi:hypothetical protein
MAGILNLVSPEDMMTPQVGKNPMQAFNDHIAFNQFLRDQGNLSRKDYNILGGYDVANRVSPGNPVVGALGNLFGGGAYNLIENFFSKTGTENSPFINDDGSSYNFRTNVTGQPLSEIPGTIFRNALGGSGLISQDLKQKYENLLAEYEGVPATGIMNIETPKGFDYNFDENVLKEEEDAQYNLDNKRSFNMDGIVQNLKDYLPFIGDKSITGTLTRGIGQFFNNIGDRIPSTPQYQRYTPGYNYGNLNPNLIDDFYDPATGLNRFDRAGTLFGQSRTLSEYLSKRRETAAAEAESQRIDAANKANVQSYIDSGGQSYDSQAQGTMYSDAILTRIRIIMARKSALEKIEYHEKICRLMQKQTFEQIQQLKNQIIRIERILIGTAAFVIISLLEKII